MAYNLPDNITPDLAEEWLKQANEDWMKRLEAHDDLVRQVEQAVDEAQRWQPEDSK